jgi:hypothetical protein
MTMRVQIFIFTVLMAAGGCGEPTPSSEQVGGALTGFVYVSAPVGGAVVTAYVYDSQTGALGREVAHSKPTAADGLFLLDLGLYVGPLRLVARGQGASYIEPATGETVMWDAAHSLEAAWTHGSASGALTFDFVHGETHELVIINPWTDRALRACPIGIADS